MCFVLPKTGIYVISRSPTCRQLTHAVPTDNKKSSAGDNDLGDKQNISDYFARFAAGEPLQNIIVLQSIPGKELVGARITKGSVKNVQLQVLSLPILWVAFIVTWSERRECVGRRLC